MSMFDNFGKMQQAKPATAQPSPALAKPAQASPAQNGGNLFSLLQGTVSPRPAAPVNSRFASMARPPAAKSQPAPQPAQTQPARLQPAQAQPILRPAIAQPKVMTAQPAPVVDVGSAFSNDPVIARGGKVGLLIDTSVSITEEMMLSFLKKAVKVLKNSDAEVVLIAGGASVDLVKSFNGRDIVTVLSQINFTNGNGTDFAPLLLRAQQELVQTVYYMTDLEGTFPTWRPRFPVKWVLPEGCDIYETLSEASAAGLDEEHLMLIIKEDIPFGDIVID